MQCPCDRRTGPVFIHRYEALTANHTDWVEARLVAGHVVRLAVLALHKAHAMGAMQGLLAQAAAQARQVPLVAERLDVLP